MMEMEFEQEISLADMEDSARRDDTKRKAEGTEKTRKAQKRKLEKLVNWGMEEEGDSGEQVEETPGVTDWIVRKQVALATKDWLLTPASTKPWTRNLRQATVNIQRMTPCQMAGKSNQLFPPPDPALTDGWKVVNPARSSLEESPKTITASRMSMEEGGMNVPTGSLSNNIIKEQDQSGKMILCPEDGEQKDPDKSMKEGGKNLLMTPSPVDGKLEPEVKEGKKVKIFP